MVLALIVFLLGTGLLYLGQHFTNKAIFPVTKNHEEARAIETEYNPEPLAFFDGLIKEPIEIQTDRGFLLKGYWIPNEGSKKTIVFAHGITYNLYGSVKYLMPFYKWGFNVLLYDHANHGISGGDVTTFGYYEKMDLKRVIDEAIKLSGEGAIIGTHGESMGAATVIQHAAIDERVAFVVADCPFQSAYDVFAYRLKVEYHLPAFLVLPTASLFSYIKTKAWFGDMSPMASLEKVTIPMFFVHGLSDDYIPVAHSKALFDAKKGPKAFYWVEQAKHAGAYTTNPKRYCSELLKFLKDNGIMPLDFEC